MQVVLARPTVARSAELAAVDAFLDSAKAGAALVLEGEAGIGKSRLWVDATERASARGYRVVSTRPAETDAELAFAGIGDLLRDSLDDVLGELPPPQRRALTTGLQLEDAAATAPDRHLVGASVLGALRVLAGEGALLVAVDDAQWLDAVSADALAFAFRRLAEDPVALLATVRIGRESSEATTLLAAVREDRLARHYVGPMSVGGIYELIRTTLATQLPRSVLMRVHQVSNGNPLFALELVRALGDRAETIGPGEPLPVPPRLEDLVRGRIRDLADETQETLLFAAALARPTVSLLRAVAGHRADEDIDVAVAAGLVELDGDVVRFAHPLLGSVHYSTTGRTRRRRIHARLADVAPTEEERARHLALANDPPDEEVASVLDMAARAALARGALAAGAELAERAIAFTAAGSPARATRLPLAAELLHAAGDTGRARGLLEQELERYAEPETRSKLLLALGRLLADGGDVRDALEVLKAARDAASPMSPIRAAVLTSIAGIAGPLEGYASAVRYAEEAVADAEAAGEPALLADALAMLADRGYMVDGDVPWELMERAMALESQVGRLRPDRGATASYASILRDAGDHDGAQPLLESLCERARETDDAGLTTPLGELAQLEHEAGNPERARTLAEEALAVAEQAGRLGSQGEAHWILASVEGTAGHVTAARAHAQRALELLDVSGMALRPPRMTLGMLELSLGDYEAAWKYFDPSLERNATEGMGRLRSQVPAAAEALARLGRVDEARALLRPWEARATQLRRRWAVAAAGRCNGLMAVAEGNLERAEADLVGSVEHATAGPHPLELGRSLLVLGEIQRRRRKKAAARETLARALEVFERVGAARWADRAREEAARIGGRRSPAGAALSATERRIAELVAAGHTNREIAELMSVSPKTVEWNLSKIYRKLGVRSRTELAAARSRARKSGNFPG